VRNYQCNPASGADRHALQTNDASLSSGSFFAASPQASFSAAAAKIGARMASRSEQISRASSREVCSRLNDLGVFFDQPVPT
jgi:hypothetical protein